MYPLFNLIKFAIFTRITERHHPKSSCYWPQVQNWWKLNSLYQPDTPMKVKGEASEAGDWRIFKYSIKWEGCLICWKNVLPSVPSFQSKSFKFKLPPPTPRNNFWVGQMQLFQYCKLEYPPPPGSYNTVLTSQRNV